MRYQRIKGPTKRFEVCIDAMTYDKLQVEADKRGISKATIVTEALKERYERAKQEQIT